MKLFCSCTEKKVIPLSVTGGVHSVPWHTQSSAGIAGQHWATPRLCQLPPWQRKSRHTQASPSTLPQHTWNLFRTTHFWGAGVWINGDISLTDASAALQRDDGDGTGIHLYALPLFSKAAYLPSTWMDGWRDGVSSGPDAKPDMWILKPAQHNLPAFRNIDHLGESQRFHWDIQHVTSSGSHEGKLWPLAILVSQATPSK